MSEICVYRYQSLISGLLVRRYKRFLADVEINGVSTTIYCPNTGSLLTVIENSNTSTATTTTSSLPLCMMSKIQNTKRKYENTLEMISVNGVWVGIHSALANKIVLSAFKMGLISECNGYSQIFTEVSKNDCKIDFELIFDDHASSSSSSSCIELDSEKDTKKKRKRTSPPTTTTRTRTVDISKRMFVEVKSVTMLQSNSIAEFPDCVSDRATKHANFLTQHVQSGGKAAILFLIQRSDVSSFTISSLDPKYQHAIHIASLNGVLILPYVCQLSPDNSEIYWRQRVTFIDPLD